MAVVLKIKRANRANWKMISNWASLKYHLVISLEIKVADACRIQSENVIEIEIIG